MTSGGWSSDADAKPPKAGDTMPSSGMGSAVVPHRHPMAIRSDTPTLSIQNQKDGWKYGCFRGALLEGSSARERAEAVRAGGAGGGSLSAGARTVVHLFRNDIQPFVPSMGAQFQAGNNSSNEVV